MIGATWNRVSELTNGAELVEQGKRYCMGTVREFSNGVRAEQGKMYSMGIH